MKKLQAKINVPFIVIVLFISVVSSLVVYYRDRAEKIKDLNVYASFTSERLSKNFIAPLWDMELEKLRDTIKFEMGEKRIYAILVKDIKDGRLIAGAQRDKNWDIVEVAEEIKPGKRMVQHSKEMLRGKGKIGVLTVYFSTRFLDQELWASLIASSVIFTVLAIVLISSLYFLINITVIKPVKDVMNLTGELNNGNLSARLNEGEDEIGLMIGAINGFTDNLHSAIKQINASMQAMADGNLMEQITLNLKGDLSHLKTSINKSIILLGQTISEVVTATEKVRAGAGEISSSANTLAEGSAEQAAAIEEISSSLIEFSSQTRANNDNAAHAQQMTTQTLDIVQKGNQQMEHMLASINEIKHKSSQVTKVIKVIDEIAFQTNLLALNAAVEAARAGKYGKGFAVVAGEVRNLAGRSAEAARNTTELIESSIKEVDEGVRNSELTASILTSISEGIEKINDLVGEISAASTDQAAKIDEINRGITQINQIVQQNSSISEETASSSEELSNQARLLQDKMNGFQLHQNAAKDTPMLDLPQKEQTSSGENEVQTREKQPPQLDFDSTDASNRNTLKKIILDDEEFGKY